MSLRHSGKLDRRRLLQGLAGGMAAGIAGCIGDDGDDGAGGDSDSDSDSDGDDDSGGIEVPDYQEGGRLEFGLAREDVVFDMVDDTTSDDSMVMAIVYDGLMRGDPQGQNYLWMAAEYETTDANDVGPADYTDYMAEYEVVDDEGPVPVLDLEWPNTALVHHPDDMASYGEGELGAGDTIRVLTRDEAGDAAADGVFGTKIEGRLHEGITFHNDEECTAENIVRSYDRLVDSHLHGQMFDTFLHAEAPDGNDGYTFELYSQEADAIAEDSLPPFYIFPSDHFEVPMGELDPREDGEVPIGTGPYELVEWEDQLLFERTDNYWLEDVGLDNMPWWDGPDDFPERPPIEEINIHFTPEDSGRVGALSAGELDLSYELPGGENTAFDDDPDYTAIGTTSTGFLFSSMPMVDTEEGGALSHTGVRKAISALCPRQDIVDFVEEGWAAPAQAPFPEPAADLASTMSYEEVEDQDWAFNAEPDHDAAESYLEDSPLEPPVEVLLETNADDDPRVNKMEIFVDELNDSGLFDATLETPANIGDWFGPMVLAPDSETDYAERNAFVSVGLGAGTDPHSYAIATRHPDSYKICCNPFHPPGTFDFVDLIDSCRFGEDVATDPELRRERYDELWPEIADVMPDFMIDYSEIVLVGGPDLQNVAGFHDRRGFLTYSLYAPFDGVVAWLERDS